VKLDAIARVRFTWDASRLRCRASAFDLTERLLCELTIALSADVRDRIAQARGPTAQLRLEEVAERHLRTMLELRY
jgi:hypothetical protein